MLLACATSAKLHIVRGVSPLRRNFPLRIFGLVRSVSEENSYVSERLSCEVCVRDASILIHEVKYSRLRYPGSLSTKLKSPKSLKVSLFASTSRWIGFVDSYALSVNCC